MEGELIYAIQKELAIRFPDSSVLFRTDFKHEDWPTYKMPLVIFNIEGGGDTEQFLGGTTMEDWAVSIAVYNLMPDNSGEDSTDYSANRIEIASFARRYFSNFTIFQSPEMLALINDFGTRWTLVGVGRAEHLQHPDGTCKGHAIHFDTISLDRMTTGSVQQTPLTTITTIDPTS